MQTKVRTGTRRLKIAVLVFACLAFGYAITVFSKDTSAEEPDAEPTAEFSEPIEIGDPQGFSKFEHSNPMHTRLPCLLCHVRTEGTTKLKLPGHMPCAGCHVPQFAENSGPICTICHTATGVVKSFPALKSFNVQFNHAAHVRQTNCATCHKTSQRGVAFSVPTRANAHVTCFQCHGPRTEVGEKNIGSCAECHQPGRPVRASEWAKAFTVNFNHQEHIRRGNMNCATCHTVRPGMVRGKQVSAPLASMHFAPAGTLSCGACHNNKRAFGPGDFANCKRCHEGKTFKF